MSRYFDDELYHWKYKERYRKGDHWVYVYDDGSASETGGRGETVNWTEHHRDLRGNWHEKHVTDETKTDTSHLLTKHTTIRTLGEEHRITEYGKLHVQKMNTKRKVADLVQKNTSKVKKFMNNHKFSPGFGGHNASMTRKVREEAARENRRKRYER